MNLNKNTYPNLNNKECGLILLSEWIGKESDLIKSTEAAMDEVETSEWPDGLISYSCLMSKDKQKILHCVQWKSQAHHMNYVKNHLPKRLENLQGKIAVIDEKSFGRFKMKESKLDKTEFTPEYILLSLNNRTSELMKSADDFSEYLFENIDNGEVINFVELTKLDKRDLSNNKANIYFLYRSYVCN